MTNEEWAASTSAPTMLEALRAQNPDYFQTLTPILHRYFIACSWRIKHLIPQKGLRNGLQGTEKWADGLITDQELYDLDWHAEADCFAFDYADTKEDIREIEKLIASIDQLRTMKFEDAAAMLREAAYFAEGTLIYPKMKRRPYFKRLFISQFLCPDLLRKHIHAPFPQ
ncbi:MAG: hypothetical protein ABJO36_12580 [Litorimonas sp.]